MDQVFALLVVFAVGDTPTDMGAYKTIESCRAAAQAYTNAECKAVAADDRKYGTCWGCMHGCSWQTNIKICGTDPRPRR